MSVTVAWCATRGFHVKITHQDTTHNHTLESGSYGNHPSVRRVQDEDVIDFVDELQAAGVKKKLMLQFLMKKTDKHVTLRDAHNFLREAEGSSTLQMRRFLEALPQVLMVDATHNTNDARYNLFSFMIHDGFGHVRSATLWCVPIFDYATLIAVICAFVIFVALCDHVALCGILCLCDFTGTIRQHALMENERADCLTNAATSFKSFKATWDQVRVIIADKDFGEILLLQAARIVLCVFHVVKYLHGEIAKKEYNIQDRDKAEDAVHMMLDATTEVDYDTARKYLY
ncbi:hypothetical protein PC120_g21149 [Phytophthora cactorum]|nr:hypothetical protein PC120_g21149 [Phytophthora cactorum]